MPWIIILLCEKLFSWAFHGSLKTKTNKAKFIEYIAEAQNSASFLGTYPFPKAVRTRLLAPP